MRVLDRSAGPALAAMLFSVDFRVGRFPINDATAPAWLMVLLWGAMIAIMALCFREPTHRHHNTGRRRDDHKKRHHRRHDGQPQGAAGGAEADEETAALNRPPSRQSSHSSQRREGYGAVLHLKEAAAAEEAAEAGASTPPGPPEFYMTPSSTVGSSVITPSSSMAKVRQHRLAKIHPLLFLVWRNKPLMITLAGRWVGGASSRRWGWRPDGSTN